MWKFDLTGLPDDLPPGKYATRVLRSSNQGPNIVIELEYRGPYDPDDPCLFPITKDAEPATA